MAYSYARLAAVDPVENAVNKMGLILRVTRELMVAGKAAASNWSEFRGKQTPALLLASLTSVQEVLLQLRLISKAIGIPALVPLAAAEADLEGIRSSITKGLLTYRGMAPANLGKITMAMRDVILSTRGMMDSAQDLGENEFEVDLASSPMDLVIFGSDMGIVLTALVQVFKFLQGNYKNVTKARNEVLQFFRILSESTLANVPEGGSYEPIVMAATIKKATALLRKNPAAGMLVLGAIEQRLLTASGK